MIFLTALQSQHWAEARNIQLPVVTDPQSVVPYPSVGYRYYGFACNIVSKLQCGDEILLLVKETGIWPSSENLHLYYRLRHSYKDLQLVEDAPGHLFLKHEYADLVTFLQVCMLNGWGGYVVTQGSNLKIFFSHDEYVALYCDDQKSLAEYSAELRSYSDPSS